MCTDVEQFSIDFLFQWLAILSNRYGPLNDDIPVHNVVTFYSGTWDSRVNADQGVMSAL